MVCGVPQRSSPAVSNLETATAGKSTPGVNGTFLLGMLVKIPGVFAAFLPDGHPKQLFVTSLAKVVWGVLNQSLESVKGFM